jgi:NADPH-dependent curcumin reductase CurA
MIYFHLHLKRRKNRSKEGLLQRLIDKSAFAPAIKHTLMKGGCQSSACSYLVTLSSVNFIRRNAMDTSEVVVITAAAGGLGSAVAK